MRGQPGFFDVDERLQRLTDLDGSINTVLARIESVRRGGES
jgi:hypothetical protein